MTIINARNNKHILHCLTKRERRNGTKLFKPKKQNQPEFPKMVGGAMVYLNKEETAYTYLAIYDPGPQTPAEHNEGGTKTHGPLTQKKEKKTKKANKEIKTPKRRENSKIHDKQIRKRENKHMNKNKRGNKTGK